MVESAVQSHVKIVVDSTEKKLIRVLHVDDELCLLKVAKQCLELQGPFHVDTAASVEEALNKIRKEWDYSGLLTVEPEGRRVGSMFESFVEAMHTLKT